MEIKISATSGVESKWPKCLIIMRHGQSQRNVEKDEAKKNGQKFAWSESPVRDVDTPLTELGRMQCQITGLRIKEYVPGDIDIVLSSPYLRAVQSAEEFMIGLGIETEDRPVHILEERVRELEFGILDGLTPEGIRAKYPEEVARRKKEGKYWYRPPGGESRPDVRLRVHSFLGTLIREFRGKTVLIVCHSVVVQAFRSLIERWGEAEYLQSDKEEDVPNASLCIYQPEERTGKLDLRYHNLVLYPTKDMKPPVVENDPAGKALEGSYIWKTK